MKSALCCFSSGSSLLAKVKGWNDMRRGEFKNIHFALRWNYEYYHTFKHYPNASNQPVYIELNDSDCLCTDTWWHNNINISCCTLHASCMCMVGNKCASIFECISTFHLTYIWGTGTYTLTRDDFCCLLTTVWTHVKPAKESGLIWTQTVWHFIEYIKHVLNKRLVLI